MNDAPTLIIYVEDLAPVQARNGSDLNESRVQESDNIALATLTQAVACGLPLKFVARNRLASKASGLIPSTDVVEISDGMPGLGTRAQRGAIAAGVLASAQSAGWLLVPADMPQLRPETLLRLCSAMHDHPLVYPMHHGQKGRPLGFSSEFFSELIRVDHVHDLERLLTRYPAVGIAMDDPGLSFTTAQSSSLGVGAVSQPAKPLLGAASSIRSYR